jgi:hypothetical protein
VAPQNNASIVKPQIQSPAPVIIVDSRDRYLNWVEYAIGKDGAGWGFGLGLALGLGSIGLALWNLGRKIDPIAIATNIHRYIIESKQRSEEIINSSKDSHRKIDELVAEIGRLNDAEKQNRQWQLGMSGDLSELKDEIDNKIKGIAAND